TLGTASLSQVRLPLGPSPVTLRVVDSQGRADTASATVTVADTSPPTLQIVGLPANLWPPNHRMVTVHPSAQSVDVCDPAPRVVLASADSSEPPDAAGDDDGRTSVDVTGVIVGGSPGDLGLRAERSRSGPGRAYRLTCTARDAAGNSTTTDSQVFVPIDR